LLARVDDLFDGFSIDDDFFEGRPRLTVGPELLFFSIVSQWTSYSTNGEFETEEIRLRFAGSDLSECLLTFTGVGKSSSAMVNDSEQIINGGRQSMD
jgi:hypothetical protein